MTPGQSLFSIGYAADQAFANLNKKRAHRACPKTIYQTAAACQHGIMSFSKKYQKDILAKSVAQQRDNVGLLYVV